MPARSVCLVTLSLSEAGPGRFGRQVSVTDIYHTILYHTIPYHTIRKPLVATAVWMRGHPTGWSRPLACISLLSLPAKQAPSRIDVTRRWGYNCFPAVILTTGKWIKGGSSRLLVDTFGRPDVFCRTLEWRTPGLANSPSIVVWYGRCIMVLICNIMIQVSRKRCVTA